MAFPLETPSLLQQKHGQKTDHPNVDLKTALLSEIEQSGLWPPDLDTSSKNTLVLCLLQRWGLHPDDELRQQQMCNLQSILEWCRASWIWKRGLFTPPATSLSFVAEDHHRPDQ